MQYELIVETNPDQQAVRLRLRDEKGVQLAAHSLQLSEDNRASWEGLFDTRAYVERYENTLLWDNQTQPATAEQLLIRLGVFLGQQVLGPAIIKELTKTRHRRTLLVHLPNTRDDVLAAAFARVPWEIARSGPKETPLLERGLVVRMITADTVQGDALVAEAAQRVAKGEQPLKVLLVFAEAPGSSPLAMRLERERLLKLFYEAILPKRRVEVDVLCHGVTRSTLQAQITATGGYHIVHWSGHGHHNLLELQGEDGASTDLTGEELVALFTDAGGFIPQVMFLSACLSGTFVDVRNWETLQAALRGERPNTKQAQAPQRSLRDMLQDPSGYTGTALALLRSGVPQVIAMRYAVGDDYARELACRFYQRLLADPDRRSTDDALALARNDVRQDTKLAKQLDAVDHANPLLFGQAGRLLEPVAGRSAQLDRIRPQPQPLLPGGRRELDCRDNFVGRSEVLRRLNEQWLMPDGPAVALVQGLAGLGKTALAAEAVHLWHRRFDWVLAFQAKPEQLPVDEFYRQMDAKLALFSTPYQSKCEGMPNAKVYLPPGQPLSGAARYDQLRINLLEALRDEVILIVLDNFETNLDPIPQSQEYICADPEWDRLLRMLVQELPSTRSRALITSRHRPAELKDSRVLWLPLGPLPIGEAVLYVRSHPALCGLLFSGDKGQALIERLLEVSRGHPLIMERLATLASDHQALEQALGQAKAQGFQTLPDLFTSQVSEADWEQERQYLEDVAIGSIDLLIRRLTPEARRLLWVVTLANEPVMETLLESIWSGQWEQAAPLGPLLAELHGAGLLSKEESTPGDQAAYAFHELVRERSRAWMTQHPEEQAGRTEEHVWIAYGGRYAALYEALQSSGRERAQEAAAEAGRRALVYLMRARAFERLKGFASWLVTGTFDPVLLRRVVAELQEVAEQVPAGWMRWHVRTYLADALRMSGRPDQALGLYEQAVAEAEAAGYWADVGWICGNWANALADVGQLEAAKTTYQRSAEAYQQVDSPKIEVIGREMEALRIEVHQGNAERVLGAIEAYLSEVRTWWQRQRAGEVMPEVPNPEFLARVLIAGLNIAFQANLHLERWLTCLALLQESEQTNRALGRSRHEVARTRFNQYGPLLQLGRMEDAQQILEECLAVFRDTDDLPAQAIALSALADLWAERGDLAQALALARQALALCNRLPNPEARARSHHNLSHYLANAGQFEASAWHLLAAIAYRVITQYQAMLATSLRNLANQIRHAAQTGGRYDLPPLADLLAQPEFDTLRQFLAQAGVEVQALQAEIDGLVE